MGSSPTRNSYRECPQQDKLRIQGRPWSHQSPTGVTGLAGSSTVASLNPEWTLSLCGVLPRRVNSESVCASEHGMVLAIIGRTWGIGVCISWSPWPTVQPPTVPYFKIMWKMAVDLSQVKLPQVSEALTHEQQDQDSGLATKHAEL